VRFEPFTLLICRLESFKSIINVTKNVANSINLLISAYYENAEWLCVER